MVAGSSGRTSLAQANEFPFTIRVLTCEIKQFLERHQCGVAIAEHVAVVDDDDLAQAAGSRSSSGKTLSTCSWSSATSTRSAAVPQHELRFLARAGRIEAVADGADALGGEIGEQPFRQRVADDCDAVARTTPSSRRPKPMREILVQHPGPGEVAIDPKSLDPERDLVPPLRGHVEEQPGDSHQRFIRQIEPGPAQAASVPLPLSNRAWCASIARQNRMIAPVLAFPPSRPRRPLGVASIYRSIENMPDVRLRLKPNARWDPTPRWERRYREVSGCRRHRLRREGLSGREHQRHCRTAGDQTGQSLLLFPLQGGGARCHLRAWRQRLHRAPA